MRLLSVAVGSRFVSERRVDFALGNPTDRWNALSVNLCLTKTFTGRKLALVVKSSQASARWSRCVAAGTLLAWMFAFVVCPSLCAFQGDVSCHGSEVEVSVCHGDGALGTSDGAAPPCHSKSSDTDAPDGASCGCALGTPTLTAKSVDCKVPEWALALPSWKFASVDDCAPELIVADVNRYVASQTWRNWANSPELYLGPGLRSLAPPSLLTA